MPNFRFYFGSEAKEGSIVMMTYKAALSSLLFVLYMISDAEACMCTAQPLERKYCEANFTARVYPVAEWFTDTSHYYLTTVQETYKSTNPLGAYFVLETEKSTCKVSLAVRNEYIVSGRLSYRGVVGEIHYCGWNQAWWSVPIETRTAISSWNRSCP